MARGEDLRGLVGGRGNEFDVGLLEAGFFESVEEEQVRNEADFEADFFALELFDGFDAGLGDNHVVSVGVVGDEDGDVGRAARAGDEAVAVGDHDGVHFAGGEGFHGRAVFEPKEFNLDAGVFEPALLFGDGEGGPARPVGVGDFERSGGENGSGAGREGDEEMTKTHGGWSVTIVVKSITTTC